MSAQMKQVAKVDTEWEEAWKAEEDTEGELSYKLGNPHGALQFNLMEIEKLKKRQRL